MSEPKRISDVPSADLAMAIIEAIQAHANHYKGGIVHSADVLGALADVTSDFLANLPNDRDRKANVEAMKRCIEQTTIAKHVGLIITPAQAH